ncbi:MAG: M20/M25/M40 family metallo-hydrolase, partial [Burkholderiaceae bacterium]|nr:M20/M25/M40 family metallo-hydrolase [Burkholderiaceae bacterium]
MIEAGLPVESDALGNVVGRYPAADPDAKTLLTGSHYDTVRDAGKYEGRLRILLPIAVLRRIQEAGIRLPYHVEVVGFADEEGLRFGTSFLASRAFIGAFDERWLDLVDDDGITLRDTLRTAGLPGTAASIRALARDPRRLAGFVEVHIEQSPMLQERDVPVGIVSSIAGGARLMATVTGTASHAGTTPMAMRRDALAAAAEMALAVEARCRQVPTLVSRVGIMHVPNRCGQRRARPVPVLARHPRGRRCHARCRRGRRAARVRGNRRTARRGAAARSGRHRCMRAMLAAAD